MRKFVLLFSISLLLIGLPSAASNLNITAPNNGTLYSSLNNLAINVSYSDPINGNINLTTNSSVWTLAPGMCFQETANTSTSCGGLSTGSYTSGGEVWKNSSGNTTLPLYDADYSTSAQSQTGGFGSHTSYFYSNYTIPSGTSAAFSHARIGDHSEQNYTVPASCISSTILNIRLKSVKASLTNTGEISCLLSNSTWNILDSTNTGEIPSGEDMYEEAVWWNISSTSINVTNGSRSIYNSSNYAEGTYTVLINATNSSGGLNQSQVTFSVVNPPSSISFVSPANGSYTNNSYLFINLTFTSTFPDTCILTFNSTNSTMTRSGTSCSLNKTSLGSGTFQYNVTVNDTYGQGILSATQTQIVDRVIPLIKIDAPTNSSSYYSPAGLTINVTSADTYLQNIYTNSSLFSSLLSSSPANFTNTSSLTNGFYDVLITVNDSAGNTNSSQVRFGWFNVIASPEAFISPTYANASQISPLSMMINSSIVNAQALSSCTLQWLSNSTNVTITPVSTNTSYSYCQYNMTVVANGTYNYIMLANNYNNTNVSGQFWSTTVLTSAPTVTINYPSNGLTVQAASTYIFTLNYTATSIPTTNNSVCSIYINNIFVVNQSSIAPSIANTYNFTASVGSYLWYVQCFTPSAISGTSQVYSFSVTQTTTTSGGGGGGGGPTPTPMPSPTAFAQPANPYEPVSQSLLPFFSLPAATKENSVFATIISLVISGLSLIGLRKKNKVIQGISGILLALAVLTIIYYVPTAFTSVAP